MNLQRLEQSRRALDRARLALSANLPDCAAADAEKSVALNPDLIEARLLEARIHLARQQPEAALRTLDALDQSHPDCRHWPQPTLLRIEALAASGRVPTAIDLAAQLAGKYPDDVRPHRVLGALLIKSGQPAAAAEHLRRVLALEPSDAAARRVLAELLQGAPQDAVDVLTPALGAEPEDDRLLRLRLARLLHDCGRQGEAEEQFAALLQEEKEDANLWLEAGQLADAMGADALALKRLRRAISLSSKRPVATSAALAALARVHMHAGRFDRAGWCWWRVGRMTRDNIEASTGLVTCALVCGRERLARKAMRQVEIKGSIQERRGNLANHWLHAAGGREIQRANLLANDPAAAATASPLEGLLTEAAQVLAEHTQAHPTRADAFYQRALCHEALGQTNEASAAASQALRINPRYGDAKKLSVSLDAADRRHAA